MKLKEAQELAEKITELWWDQGKISYKWCGNDDVSWLAEAIFTGKIPPYINEPVNKGKK